VILAAIGRLGLGTWLAELPQGLDTLLMGGAYSLSAGEAQLLAFVRVFLGDPGLVILDEASSRLDPVTERRLQRAVDVLLQNRTGILIAHRLESLRRVDEILILENGRIVEQGARTELLQDKTSRFYQLQEAGGVEIG
jgi:ATP-binding cassette subfamily B protein